MSPKWTAAVIVAAALPASAYASPGAGSISSPDGAAIYKVSPDGGASVVTKIRGSDRTAVAERRLPGSFEVPAVAGVVGGLSPDGRTLVLGGHPSARVSQFALLDTRTLRVRRVLSLNGDYSFDATSPDASTLYVIRFLSQDGTRYAVQALDLTDSHPTAATLVEKGEPGEQMSGNALARTSNPGGGWVYTLYDGAGKAPFVHALSTVDKYTVCIDLHALAGRPDIATLGLKLHPRTNKLDVTAGGTAVAAIQTDSFEVTNQPAAAPKRTTRAAPPKDSESTPWALIILASGALLLALAATTKHLQTKPDPTNI